MFKRTRRVNNLPPAIVLGGDVIALSLVRSLGRIGVKVHFFNQLQSNRLVVRSKYCHEFIPAPPKMNIQDAWQSFLLSSKSDYLQGAVLFPCSDDALEFTINHYAALKEKYLMDNLNIEAQRGALNKLTTYQAAKEAGIPFPKFRHLDHKSVSKLDAEEIPFPVLVKPIYTHVFLKNNHFKHFLAKNQSDLKHILRQITTNSQEFILLEYIEGPDSQLCSYYTYIDENENLLFDFTKRIIRRFPVSSGLGCYHRTDNVAEVKELSVKFLRQIGLKGLSNIEFKRDHKDNQLKIIECNARFTAANCLLENCGLDLPAILYKRILNMPHTFPVLASREKRLWYPFRDFKAFLSLYKKGELDFLSYFKSILHTQTFPYFAWDDPLPSIENNFNANLNRLRDVLPVVKKRGDYFKSAKSNSLA